MQEKCPVTLTCRFGVVIVNAELTWGHVRQTVLLQGKVAGGCSGSFQGGLLLPGRSFRFLARVKAFSGGFLLRLWFHVTHSFSAYSVESRCALFQVTRARVRNQARELILTNFLTVFDLVP